MNTLLRYIFFLLIILSTVTYKATAQVNNLRRQNAGRSNRNPKLEAARNRYISQQLSLTDEEARKFWPVYNRYQEELTAIRILKRLNNSSANANGTEQVDKDLQYDTQMINIRKHYRDEFMKILPPAKLSELYKSEQEFTTELIKQLSERSIRAGN
jgi:hypothetical protein